MRILHLTPELPFAPGGNGGQTREFFLCRRLAELGHDVLNISPAEPGFMARTADLRAVGVESWVAPRPASQAMEAAEALLRHPGLLAAALARPWLALQMAVFETRLRPLVRDAVARWRPDVAIVGHDMAAAWVADLPAQLPTALTLHNLSWHMYASRARLAGGADALRLRAEAARFRRHVTRWLGRFAVLVPVSTLEAEELRDLGHPRVELIPTGVDTRVLAPAAGPGGGPPTLLFTGTMSYGPNSEGIAWFVREVWPLVRAQAPDAELLVVGKDPPAAVTGLHGRDGIEVTGFVASVAPYFARATAVVVPILTGAGIRVKIVEAMSAGRPIVSTTLGWEGLAGVEPGRHLLVADGRQDFAAGALALLHDPPLRERLAAEARDLAVSEYDWRSLGDRLEAVLESCTSR